MLTLRVHAQASSSTQGCPKEHLMTNHEMEKKTPQFRDCEIEVLLTEVEYLNKILLGP